LNTIEHIIHNELVRDFYEYGTQKDISIYSKSHIGSRMASIMQTKKMIEDKYNNVLQIFNNDDQLESDQLERILEASK